MWGMRMQVVLLLIGFLALCALPTDAAGRYSIVGIGVESCGAPAAHPGAEGEAAYRVGFEALVRITCNVDSVLLEMQRYSRANAADEDDVASRFGARLHQKARSH